MPEPVQLLDPYPSDRREFQSLGPATEKARLPRTVLVHGIVRLEKQNWSSIEKPLESAWTEEY